MTQRTRIGIISQALAAEGGNGAVRRKQYFIDGPDQFYHRGTPYNKKRIVNYKIEPNATGVSRDTRQLVAERLKQDPDVFDSYLTWDGSLRVQFEGVIG